MRWDQRFIWRDGLDEREAGKRKVADRDGNGGMERTGTRQGVHVSRPFFYIGRRTKLLIQ